MQGHGWCEASAQALLAGSSSSRRGRRPSPCTSASCPPDMVAPAACYIGRKAPMASCPWQTRGPRGVPLVHKQQSGTRTRSSSSAGSTRVDTCARMSTSSRNRRAPAAACTPASSQAGALRAPPPPPLPPPPPARKARALPCHSHVADFLLLLLGRLSGLQVLGVQHALDLRRAVAAAREAPSGARRARRSRPGSQPRPAHTSANLRVFFALPILIADAAASAWMSRCCCLLHYLSFC